MKTVSPLALVWRLGWRNLWRNSRRTALSIGAVAVAFAVLIVLEGLREGMARQMLDNGTRLMLGHLQMHDGAYLPDRGLHDTLGGADGTDTAALLAAAEATPGVAAATPRVFGFGLLSTGPRSAGAQLMGVDPAREARVTRLLGAVVAGTGLDGAPPRAVLLGRTLAEELGASVGDEVAVVTQAVDGSIGNELLRVQGILDTRLAGLDRTLAILRLPDLQALLALEPGRIHEVAVRVHDPGQAAEVARALAVRGTLPPAVRAEPWQRLAPALVDYVALLRGWNWVMVAIVGTFAAFGVLNTMLMAVFERTPEIGVLAALGVRPWQLLGMVVAESLGLATVGLGAGLGLGAAGMAYFVEHGWDLSRWTRGLTIAGVLVDPVIRGAWTWATAGQTALALAAITILAALVPAWRAARMRPVDALSAPVE
jgi:ABC-type lipoprotein release transport system permease subunit